VQNHPQGTKRIQFSFKELIREQPILKATYLNLKTTSFRDDYSATVIANRKGAPLTQALVPSRHPTTDDLFPSNLPPGVCYFSFLFFDRLLAPGMLVVSS